jgi:hypothetical protein
LTGAGSATLRLVPAIGIHSYKAVFAGTTADLTSTSNPSTLTVTTVARTFPTTTTIVSSGRQGDYTLTASVTGIGSALSPTGTVSFLDTSNEDVALGQATLGIGTAQLGFANPSNPVAGFDPTALAAADFNGDGVVDIAAINNLSDTVTVLLGKGDGTFTALAASPATGSFPFAIVAADFNGDGVQDLATSNNGSNTVTVLLGNGDGTFNPQVVSPMTGDSPYTIATADFDGDGKADLAIANNGDNTVTVLLGNGDGTFTADASPSTGKYPSAIVAADFNGDGIDDLAVTNTGDNNVTVLLGNGDGTFTASGSPATGNMPTGIAIADFNADGVLDMAVANFSDGTLTMLLGRGDGTFTTAASPVTASEPYSLVVGDFNGDSIPDLAVASSPTATILLGDGDGTFEAAINLSTGGGQHVAVADFNGDGLADLAFNGSSFLDVSLAEMTNTAAATATGIAFPGTMPHQIEASYPGGAIYSGSVSSTISLRPTAVGAKTVSMLQVTSGGSPVTTVASGSLISLTATVQADGSALTAGQVNFCDASATYCTGVNVLGTQQLASSGTATLRFVPALGSHTYKAVFLGTVAYASSDSGLSTLTVTGTYPTTTTIASSGSAGDYTLTANVAGVNGPTAPTGSVSFVDTSNTPSTLGTAELGPSTRGWNFPNLLSPVKEPFEAGSPFTFPYGSLIIAPGDFNGDGIPDILTADAEWGNIIMMLGKGDGTFTTGPTLIGGNPGGPPLEGPNGGLANLVVGDFNADGILDFYVVYAFEDDQLDEIALFTGNGDGSFTAAGANMLNGLIPDELAIGDFNGDGIPDLAINGFFDILGDPNLVNQIEIRLGGAAGGLYYINTTQSVAYFLVADFNGDGLSDLLEVIASGGVSVLLNNGDNTFTAAPNPPAAANLSAIITGDFNGDGKTDLAMTNTDGNAVTVLLGNGDGTFSAGSAPTTGANLFGITVGDFNADGVSDLAVTNPTDSTVVILLGNGDGTFKQTAVTPSAGSNAYGLVIADFNNDGFTDIAYAIGSGGNGSQPQPLDTISVQLTQLTQTATATAMGISASGSGTHQVDARYAGDLSYGASTSATVGLIAVQPPGIAVSTTTTALTISSPGASASDTIQVSSMQGFSGAVALSCQVIFGGSVEASDPPTCSLNPRQANVTAASPLTATLTIATTAASSSLRPYGIWQHSGEWLASLFFFGFLPLRSRKSSRLFVLIGLVVGFAAIGCGGGTGGTKTPSVPGTTSGGYTVIVTATSAAITGTTTISLNVQ